MEIVLLIAILILLFHFNSSLKSEVSRLRLIIFELETKLESLLKSIRENPAPTSKGDKISLRSTQTEDSSVIEVQPVAKDPITIKLKEEKIPEIVYAKDTNISNPIKLRDDVSEKVEEPVIEENSKERLEPKPAFIASKSNYWDRFKERNPDLEKFIGENLINKIGVLILVLGISYFVKYAIDKNWINEPARVGIGILAGGLILAVAQKLQKKYAAFSSVLVAGAIAVFYFTIAIAFHEYQLFNQTVAFVLMVLITAFSSVISLVYNRMELAILSLIGGFAVPFMISNDSFTILFSYIIILDIGILALAYFKKWDLVKIIAFGLTTLLFGGSLLIELKVDSPHYGMALVFAFIFYFIFVLANFINNIRNKENFSQLQLLILLLNTAVFYGFGMLILSQFHPEFTGLFTTVLALFNLGLVWVVNKMLQLDKTAIYLLIGLTLTFITLAIPVQFQGNHITLFWAAESVLLIWLAQKSQIKSYRFTAVIIQVLMFISLFIDWIDFYTHAKVDSIVLNPIFITGSAVVISLVLIRYLLRNETITLYKFNLAFDPIKYKRTIQLLTIVTGYCVGLFEIGYQSKVYLSSGSHSALILPIIYHLSFTAIVCFFLFKKKGAQNIQVLNIIAAANIFLFTFVFSQYAFIELKENAYIEQTSQIAYYFHFVMLAFVGYFGYLLYQTNRKQMVFDVTNSRYTYWIIAFFVVFIFSTEVILEGLKIRDLQFPVDQGSELISQGYIKVAKNKIIKTAIPVLWGVLAFVFLILGIKKQVKEVRIIALALLGITIVKLFTYDISNVSETGKIIAFILLGILILIISFVYQKIKVLVIDDDKSDENNENN